MKSEILLIRNAKPTKRIQKEIPIRWYRCGRGRGGGLSKSIREFGLESRIVRFSQKFIDAPPVTEKRRNYSTTNGSFRTSGGRGRGRKMKRRILAMDSYDTVMCDDKMYNNSDHTYELDGRGNWSISIWNRFGRDLLEYHHKLDWTFDNFDY